MSTNIKIAPSILSADFTRLGDEVRAADAAGAEMIHIDVMDGRFVPNITMGPLVVKAVSRVTDLPLDVHLMIVEPEKYISAFVQAGSTRITAHVEATVHLHRLLTQIRSEGCAAGVALNPHTPATAISEVMHLVDVINVMTVNPGFGGQSFLTETTPKIARLREMIDAENRDIDLEVDGGINVKTAATATQAGANVLIAGSSVFGYDDGIQAGIESLREAAGQLG